MLFINTLIIILVFLCSTKEPKQFHPALYFLGIICSYHYIRKPEIDIDYQRYLIKVKKTAVVLLLTPHPSGYSSDDLESSDEFNNKIA